MIALYLVFCVLLHLCSVNCDNFLNITDEDYNALPPIFHIDEHENCKQEGKVYCRISVKLGPRNNSKYWNIIKQTIENRKYYNHDELFHAICVDNFCSTRYSTIPQTNITEKELTECYSNKYNHLDLEPTIIRHNCDNTNDLFKIRTYDIFLLCFIIVYVLYVVYASVYDYFTRGKSFSSTSATYLFILPFSIRRNWSKLKRNNENPDFQKLKCVQGIRFYNTLLIIFCHTFSSYIGGFVKDTRYLEEIEMSYIRHGMRTLFVFLVQTFFFFSAFLLSYHMFQNIQQLKVFRIRHIILTFINRYLRIISPVLAMILLATSVWIIDTLFQGPVKELFSDVEFIRCQKNWWTSLLFINNHYNHHEMCYFITWYLAADTQLYAVALIVLSIIWIIPKRTKWIICTFLALSITAQAIICYIYDLDIIYRLTPENAKYDNYRNFAFNAIYTSTYTNMATYILGIGFGYIYYKNNDVQFFRNKLLILTWWISFFGIPLTVIWLSTYEYNKFVSAILSGILKPLYALGIGIGILGMSQNIGGIAKKICEWKLALFFGNFTYSTYVVQYGIVFHRTATATQPLDISDYVLITSFLRDAIFSFICGLLMHVLVEMPALQLQNSFIPQVRTKRAKEP